MFVRVLVGMDFITHNGMIIDFYDGYTVCAAQEQPHPLHLPRNNKGHFMVDLVQFLTQGDLCHRGHPQIQILLEEGTNSSEWSDLSSHRVVNCATMFTHEFENVKVKVSGHSSREQLFAGMVERRLRMNRQSGLMGSLISALSSTTPSSPTTHGDREEEDQGARPLTSCSNGSQGSASLRGPVAMQGSSLAGQAQVQPVGTVGCARVATFDSITSQQKGHMEIRHRASTRLWSNVLWINCRMMEPNMSPEAELVQAVITKVTAEERLSTLLDEYKMAFAAARSKVEKAKDKMNVVKAAAKSGAGSSGSTGYSMRPHSPRLLSPTHSWEAVSPQRARILDHLTEDEIQQLQKLAMERKAMAERPVDVEIPSDPNYDFNETQ